MFFPFVVDAFSDQYGQPAMIFYIRPYKNVFYQDLCRLLNGFDIKRLAGTD